MGFVTRSSSRRGSVDGSRARFAPMPWPSRWVASARARSTSSTCSRRRGAPCGPRLRGSTSRRASSWSTGTSAFLAWPAPSGPSSRATADPPPSRRPRSSPKLPGMHSCSAPTASIPNTASGNTRATRPPRISTCSRASGPARSTGARSMALAGSPRSPGTRRSSSRSEMNQVVLERPLVPRFLLAGFADGAGQLMAERRDRTRRRLVAVDAAVAELGGYALSPTRPAAAPLARLLAEVDAQAAEAILQITTGAFPPTERDRASLALVLATQLLLGRYHRAEAGRAASLVGQLIVSTIEAASDDESEKGEPEGSERPGRRAAGSSAAGRSEGTTDALVADVMLPGSPPVGRSLASLPALARQLAGRTWQVVRFPAPVLLTSDTPVVLWAPSAAAKLYQVGLGSAHEVRVPLDSRHALIVARRAPAGEIVRDLGERHARALNRTIAEGAVEWMYYHPASDPLEGVELPPQESD